MEASYKWAGWGILPLMLSTSQAEKLLSKQPWQHWTANIEPEMVKDIRRFYTRASTAIFRPMEGGRYTLALGGSSVGELNTNIENCIVKITQLQLVLFEEVALLYIHMSSADLLTAHQISSVNRTIYEWQPRTHHHQVTHWSNIYKEEKTLTNWISELLGISIESDATYGEDAYGHELANCSWVKNESEKGDGSLCVSELSAGIKIDEPRYLLSEQEREYLTQNQFSVWKDWRCQLNRGRLVYVDDTPGTSSLKWNLDEFGYYLDLYAMVIYQRIILTHYKEELLLSSEGELKYLFQRISKFRQSYKISHMSTYPFAERLYKYFCEQADIENIEEKAFVELEHSHTLWKQEKEETSNFVLLLISLIAALLLPASSIATIYALTDEQMRGGFWGVSALLTIVTILVIIWLPLKKHKKKLFRLVRGYFTMISSRR